MDKGTLIYIILGILYMLFSAGKKKKKNPTPGQPKPKQPEQGNTDMSLEDMIRALRGETQTKPVNEVVEEPVVQKHELMEEARVEAKKQKQPEPKPKYRNIEAEAMLRNDHKALDPEDGIEFHFAGEDDDTGIEFDARQAVIYHEIMKRPEY